MHRPVLGALRFPVHGRRRRGVGSRLERCARVVASLVAAANTFWQVCEAGRIGVVVTSRGSPGVARSFAPERWRHDAGN